MLLFISHSYTDVKVQLSSFLLYSFYLIFCHTTSFAKFRNHLIIELWSPVCAVSVAHLSNLFNEMFDLNLRLATGMVSLFISLRLVS